MCLVIITEEFWAEKHNEWNNELSMLLRKIETNNNANHDYMELGIKLLEVVENHYLRYISLSDIEKSETIKIIVQNFYLDGEKASYTYKKTHGLISLDRYFEYFNLYDKNWCNFDDKNGVLNMNSK